MSSIWPPGRPSPTASTSYWPRPRRRPARRQPRLSRLTALRRTSRDNRSEQVPVEDVWGIGYDWLLYTAHALVIAELDP
jgi:hypothetical protein